MIDNTRVNELQDKLLQAMDILNASALNRLSFDKTIVCTIEDDSNKENGSYVVTDGARSFSAYSSDTRLRNKEQVYVTIPQGNFENQKMIIGKKLDEDKKPFVFTTPFDTIFDMTDNIAEGKSIQGSLIANALNKYGNENYEHVTIYEEECSYCGFTRMGLKVNVKSWIKDAIRGTYGLAIILTVTNPNTASSQQLKEQEYYYTFSNKEMYGNSYAFETDYEQQLVIPLEDIQGTITRIKVNFYQQANFFDKFNSFLPCSEKGYKITDGNYDKDEEGDYQLSENDTLLSPNIFVQDLYLCFGYDISKFDSDFVQIYTQNSTTYKHSNENGNDGVAQNEKVIKMRWVHVEDGTPKDMVAAKENEIIETPYEIRWYRYQVGASAADPYCGVYWTRIEGENDFSYVFNPNVEKQQEKIKAIIIYNSITPYRSNELLFENEQDLPPSQEAIHIQNALTIVTEDNTNGNYMIYGQDNSIKDTEYGKITRSLSVWFDANSNGILESNEKIQEDQSNNLLWTFPASNTMIELLNTDCIEVTEGEGEDIKVIAYQVYTHNPWYKISSYYSPSKLNNTITCQYELNGRVYTTEKELTFGTAGTMGSNQTLVIDFAGDTNAVNVSQEANENVVINIQLYDNQNIDQVIEDGVVTWAWYYNGSMDNGETKFPLIIENEKNSSIIFNKNDFNIEHLYILQGSVGKLTTYFPIPIQSGGYSHIKGPTQVIYQANGEPTYNRDPYVLYQNNDPTLIELDWQIIHNIVELDEKKLKEKERYIGAINEYTGGLQPLSLYTKDAPVYGVQAVFDGKAQWTQPILVLQNQWPNGVINEWDGKSLVLDEENNMIISAAIAAGKKNDDNTFSGVMLGDWSGKDAEESITKQTGIYGFDHGAMSYAFKEDGTAFLGKDGVGRIEFNGIDATIYSPKYKSNEGMMIDLNAPYLEMKYDTQTIRIDASKSGGISSANDPDAPFKIGDNFAADWDGTIYAKNGNFEGTITGSVLEAPSSGIIYLDGVLTVANKNDKNQYVPQGYFGEMFSGLPGVQNEDVGGVGISASNAVIGTKTVSSLVKVTAANVGMKYGDYNLTITKDGVSIKDNGDCAIRFQNGTILLQGKYDKGGYTGINIRAAQNSDEGAIDDEPVVDCNIPPQNQFGLYARFA